MNGSLKMYKLILFFNILLLSQFSFSKNDCNVPIVPSTKDGAFMIFLSFLEVSHFCENVCAT